MNDKIDEIHLLWSESQFYDFEDIGEYVSSQLTKRGLCRSVVLRELKIKDPTDHNEIYPKLLAYLESVQEKNRQYIAAISSGTPSMQACWILIAESGAFPLKLVRSDDPKWGVPVVRPVKLSAALPRIERIVKENKELKKSALPRLKINRQKAEVHIGEKELILSPMEFVYYVIFARRAMEGRDYLRFGIANVPEEFFVHVLGYHNEFFPDAESARITLEKAKSIACSTFRANVTRMNKKIKRLLKHDVYARYFLIESEGKKYSKRYGINLEKQLITIR
ncbi:MAG: hypothetical protein K1X85_04900 [Ignavibacteria bacterium]|nr:hypothetical protein [Ignavibacteria bacterium]